MPEPRYALGLDYGTNSARALLVDAATGEEVATAVVGYPSGNAGVIEDPNDPNLARQNPSDYIHVLVEATRKVIRESGAQPSQVVGIGVDTTGSTPMPVDAQGVPLADLPRFQNDPNAAAWLWKDHTSFREAEEITELAKAEGTPYMEPIGGTYSSEWFWAKILHCARVAPEVFEAAHGWVELQDYVPAYLTGNRANPKRGVCAGGHKALYRPQWGGLPDAAFLGKVDPRLADLRARLYEHAYPANVEAGKLTSEVAAELGLNPGTPVAVGLMDAHAGAVGAGVKVGTLVKVLGTSSCDITVRHPSDSVIPGICGVVPGSVLPECDGVEAGQSAVGDLYNWFVGHLVPPEYAADPHALLSAEALGLKPGESGLLALDWNNGNRTILVDPLLSGLLVGQSLHTSAPEVYRALIEATAFGSHTILQQLETWGVPVDTVVACGGIAEKSPLVMQIYADVCGKPFRLSRSAQTCALGAAIFGSVVGGAHRDVATAVETMTGLKDTTYTPNPEAVSVYAELYALYRELHDAFGLDGTRIDLSGLMKKLIALRERVRSA